MGKVLSLLLSCVLLISCSKEGSDSSVGNLKKDLIQKAGWAEPIRFIDSDLYGIYTSSKGVFIFKKNQVSPLTVLIENHDSSSRLHMDGSFSSLTYWLDENGSYDKLLVHDSNKDIILFDSDGDGILEGEK